MKFESQHRKITWRKFGRNLKLRKRDVVRPNAKFSCNVKKLCDKHTKCNLNLVSIWSPFFTITNLALFTKAVRLEDESFSTRGE